jgi:hypothetical protein
VTVSVAPTEGAPGHKEGHMADEIKRPEDEQSEDVEGHGNHRKMGADEEDVEGHGNHRKYSPEDDTEGHGMHRKVSQDDDVEGHGMHRK